LYKRSIRAIPKAGPAPATARPRAAQRPAAHARPDRRQAILLAAEKLFAQRGYQAINIRQMAEEAGVPLALVGYCFGQKHELFTAIFAHWNSTIEARLAGLNAALQAAQAQQATLLVPQAQVDTRCRWPWAIKPTSTPPSTTR
jgi:AcrR family transcriptional regulator